MTTEYPVANCTSCGAEIIWVKTPAGRNAPLDAKLTTVYVVEGFPITPRAVRGHLTHWATCPNAKAHREAAEAKRAAAAESKPNSPEDVGYPRRGR